MSTGLFNIPDVGPTLAALDLRFTPHLLEACDIILRDGTGNPSAVVVAALAERCYSLQAHMRRALSDSDVHYLSWAARTLFELKVVTTHACSSEENIEWLRREMIVDTNDAVKRTLVAIAALNNADISAQTDEIMAKIKPDRFRESDKAAISPDEKYFRMDRLAKQTGFESEYSTLFMLLSKFAHASGLSINLALLPQEHIVPIRNLFFELGATNAIAAIEKLSNYAQSQGLPALCEQ